MFSNMTGFKKKIIHFLRWIWSQCTDKRTFLLLLAVIFIVYIPVWGGYLVHLLFGWAWGSAVATAYVLFWAGPFTPFFPLCIGITLSLKKLFELPGRRMARKSKPATALFHPVKR